MERVLYINEENVDVQIITDALDAGHLIKVIRKIDEDEEMDTDVTYKDV